MIGSSPESRGPYFWPWGGKGGTKVVLPILLKGTLEAKRRTVCTRIGAPRNCEFYMVITTPEASWGGIFGVVLVTLGHMSWKGLKMG